MTINFTAITCVSCGVPFGMSDDVMRARKQDRKQFWCTNGHQQHFTGKSDAEKLAETLRVLDRERTLRQAAVEELETQAEARREAVRKGNQTKARKRALMQAAKQ